MSSGDEFRPEPCIAGYFTRDEGCSRAAVFFTARFFTLILRLGDDRVIRVE